MTLPLYKSITNDIFGNPLNVNWNFDEDNMCTNLNEVNDKYTQYNIKDKNIFKKTLKVKNFTSQEIIKIDKLYNLKEKKNQLQLYR